MDLVILRYAAISKWEGNYIQYYGKSGKGLYDAD